MKIERVTIFSWLWIKNDIFVIIEELDKKVKSFIENEEYDEYISDSRKDLEFVISLGMFCFLNEEDRKMVEVVDEGRIKECSFCYIQFVGRRLGRIRCNHKELVVNSSYPGKEKAFAISSNWMNVNIKCEKEVLEVRELIDEFYSILVDHCFTN
jgi:hypothetical protein